MSYKKINKEFCLTDNTVNVYGYRLLTQGLQLNKFKPAIGYLMHDRDKGVAVRWEDFRIEGEMLFAKPVVNLSAFPSLADEIESGFYSGASVGKIVALELSNDESLMLEGQTGPTVTKWFPREASIVDIPGNYNALAQLYDERNNLLHDLSDGNKGQTSFSDAGIILSDEQLNFLQLNRNSPKNKINEAVNSLFDKAKHFEELEKTMKGERGQRVKSILSEAVKGERITQKTSDELFKHYEFDPVRLEEMINTIADIVPKDLPERFKGKTFLELYMSGGLEVLKRDFPTYYNYLKRENH